MAKKINMFPPIPEAPYQMSDVDIPAELFEPLPDEDRHTDQINRPSISYWQNAYMKIKADKLAVIGFIIIFLMFLLAVFGPIISPYTYEQQDYEAIYQAPNARHWLGTDMFGRDQFTRISYGARISLTIGFVAALVNMVIGSLYGGIAGFFGGKVDMIMMRIVDIFAAIPSLLYIILIMMFLGSNLQSILIALCLTYWFSTARQTRAQILTIRNQDFALAAKVAGETDFQILIRHLIPNSIGPIIVTVTFLVPAAIFEEAFLSFIGVGLAAPKASLGVLINDGYKMLRAAPYMLIYPALAIILIMVCFSILGDGLRDALDPRMKH